MAGAHDATDERPSKGTGTIKLEIAGDRPPGALQRAPTTVRTKLKALDRDGNGQISEEELVGAVEELVKETQMRRVLMWTTIGLVVCVVLMVGMLTGMTWGLLMLSKDTELDSSDGVMLVKRGSDKGDVVKTGIVDMQVNQTTGALITRVLTSKNGTVNPSVIKTAPFMIQRGFDSRVSIRALMELRYLYLTTGPSEIALVVHGVARIVDNASPYGSVVKIITSAGTIILQGTAISFSEDVAPVFVDAGFIVDAQRRRLQGVYDVLGFFSAIENADVFNLPSDQSKPALPKGPLRMRIKVYEPCVKIQKTKSKKSLKDHCMSTEGVELPGVEVVDGERYATSIEEAIRLNNLVRTVYSYPAFPTMTKTEVADMNTKKMSAWVNAPALANASAVAPYVCRTLDVPGGMYKDLALPSANLTVSFTGFESKVLNGESRDLRHFIITAWNQRANATILIELWDTQAKPNTPVLLEGAMPLGGKVRFEFQIVETIDASSIAPATFVVPNFNKTCNNYPPPSSGIVWLESAYKFPPKKTKVNPYPASLGKNPLKDIPIGIVEQRYKDTSGYSTAAIVPIGDEYNGTAAYANMTGRRRLHADATAGAPAAQAPNYKNKVANNLGNFYTTIQDCWDLLTGNIAASSTDKCDDLCAVSIGLGDTLEFSASIQTNWGFTLGIQASGFIAPFLVMSGNVNGYFCPANKNWGVSGCLGLSVGWEQGGGGNDAAVGDSKAEMQDELDAGLPGIAGIQICGGYDSEYSLWFFSGTFSLGLPAGVKGELTAVMKYISDCGPNKEPCFWVDSFELNAYWGFELFGFNAWEPWLYFPFITDKYMFSGEADWASKRTEEDDIENYVEGDTAKTKVIRTALAQNAFTKYEDITYVTAPWFYEYKGVSGKWNIPFNWFEIHATQINGASDRLGLTFVKFFSDYPWRNARTRTHMKDTDYDPKGSFFATMAYPQPFYRTENALTSSQVTKWTGHCGGNEYTDRAQNVILEVQFLAFPIWDDRYKKGGSGFSSVKWGPSFTYTDQGVSKTIEAFTDHYSIVAIKIGCGDILEGEATVDDWHVYPPNTDSYPGAQWFPMSCVDSPGTDNAWAKDANAGGYICGYAWDPPHVNQVRSTAGSGPFTYADYGKTELEWVGLSGFGIQCCLDKDTAGKDPAFTQYGDYGRKRKLQSEEPQAKADA